MSNRRMVVILAVSAVVGLTGVMSLNAFLPAIADDLGTSVSILGQVNTATFIVGALLGLMLGPLADHYGLRRTIVLAALLLVVSSFATAASTEYWMLLLSRIPAGLGVLGAVSVAIASTRLPEANRRKGIGWIVSAMPLGAILGMPALAMFAHYTTWRLSLVILGFITFVLATLLWRFVPADPPLPVTSFNPSDVLKAYRPILRHRPSVFLYLADMLRGVTWFGFLIYAASFFIQELGLTLQHFALFGVSGGTAYLIGTRFGSGSPGLLSLGVVFYGSTALMAVSGVLALSADFNLIVTLALLHAYAFMGGVGFPAITIMIAEATQGGKGTTMMLRNAGQVSSQAVGAGAGGALLATGGYSLFGFGLFGFAMLAAVAVILAARGAAVTQPYPALEKR